jgi:hypothetical protein
MYRLPFKPPCDRLYVTKMHMQTSLHLRACNTFYSLRIRNELAVLFPPKLALHTFSSHSLRTIRKNSLSTKTGHSPTVYYSRSHSCSQTQYMLLDRTHDLLASCCGGRCKQLLYALLSVQEQVHMYDFAFEPVDNMLNCARSGPWQRQSLPVPA